MLFRAKESEFDDLKGRVSLHLQAIAGKDVKIEQMRSQIVAETSRVLDQQKDLTSK